MGYTRQSVALMAAFLSIEYFLKGKNLRSFFWLIVAFGFHVSAVFSLGFFILKKFGKFSLFIFGVAFVLGYQFILNSSAGSAIEYYTNNEVNSGGVLFRLLLSLVPAYIFLWSKKSIVWVDKNKLYLEYLSLCSVIMFLLAFIMPSTSVIDRFSFYLSPLQYIVMPKLTSFFHSKTMGIFFVISYYFVVLLGVIYFSNNFDGWLPYRNYFSIFFMNLI
jgi:hypothetical protein